MITGNKGEWSEVYTLLRLLADKQVYAGDGHLNRVENLLFPIVAILRDESSGTYQFNYEDELVIVTNEDEEYRLPVQDFHQQAHFLFTLMHNRNIKGAFGVPEVEKFINSFGLKSIKANSKIKNDIKIVINDFRTGMQPLLGFSIKSQLGSPSTLLNPSKENTNFIYKIDNIQISNCDADRINLIGSKTKIKDRIQEIIALGGTLSFQCIERDTFQNNLMLIDSCLPSILAECLLIYYTSDKTTIASVVGEVSERNPLDYPVTEEQPFYAYKIKKLLTEIALGMLPGTVWNGIYEVTGGYLVVKRDGDILCYHVYNRNQFEDYLFNNTKFETPSSTRHDFGSIVDLGSGKQGFKLNVQIRFIV